MASDHSSREATELEQLLHLASQGDQEALSALLTKYRDRLHLMVRLRMDQRLQGRIDPSDVVQEAYVEAVTRLGEYLRQPTMPFFLWLRFLTAQRLLILRRHHLGVKARDPRREVSLYQGLVPEASSAALAAHLVGQQTGPSQAAQRAEMQARLQAALEKMEPIDREVLILRHFEQLSNSETARVLGLKEPTASQRYARALLRLKDMLQDLVEERRED